MSKAGMSHPSVKQENSPFKKDNRGQNTPGDKRHSGNFGKNERPSPNTNNRSNMNNQNQQSRERERRERNEQHGESSNFDNTQNDKDKDASSGEKKFTGRCRLFVGNLTPDVTEADFRKMFEAYGEISEVYVNTQRGFGFIRLDYRQNAEAAKAALDGMQRKGRILRVRFATHGAALKVKNLHSHVSNELLEQSFVQFGDLERCIVIVDDRGKSTGEGIVEFVRKPGASSALRRITEGVFLMGSDPKPISVEPLEQKDEEDGMPEKFLQKTDQYKKEREKEPRFAPPGTFEYEFGMRWKQLDELEKQRIEQVKMDTEKARIELEEEMQNALYDYQAEQIRQDLIRQQEELRRLEELRNNERMRLEMKRQKEDREKAELEERRREMVMKMGGGRQQEMARGRGGAGPMDGPGGMRSREEMMMAERFGDRMGDRMGERMPDRMGDRMGRQGGPGFGMWKEEQQRNEAQMKGMRGGNEQPPNRGSRDMRGPPGPQQPMQGGPSGPQGGPPGGMERGGPGGPGASAGPSGPGPNGPGGQNKEGPKPLMQQGPGFSTNSPGNNGPSNNPNSGPDGNNMNNMQAQRRRLEQGVNNAFENFQNQRGVLGTGPVAGALGAAAAAIAGQLRGAGPGGMGGGSPNMFQGNMGNMGNMNERMMMERRREAAAREEMDNIKRMRRF